MTEQAHPRQRAIDPNLFDWTAAAPALLASRCSQCRALAFPANPSCMACGSTDVVREELPRRGTLWSWTIQRFMLKEPYLSSDTPETFKPYGVGYVELGDTLRVQSRLMENDPEQLQIGAEMELVFYIHRTDKEGTEIINYAFQLVNPETSK